MKNIQLKFGLSFDHGNSSITKDFSCDMDQSFILKSLLLVGLVLLLSLPKNLSIPLPPAAGQDLFPLWTIGPFGGMLLSIALIPLINMSWWEKNMAKISLFWVLLFTIPASLYMGGARIGHDLFHIIVMDYIPFIILVTSLFVITGGINVSGELPGVPLVNSAILGLGALLASIVGTTGATVLLIRPLIRANKTRKYQTHTMIFLIFIVSNIAGVLTPLGDPPLFIGYLHNVPFFWTLKLFPAWLFNVLVLLFLYTAIDNYLYRKELDSRKTAARISVYLYTGYYRENITKLTELSRQLKKVKIRGPLNFLLLLGVIMTIILSGMLASQPLFLDAATNTPRGLTLFNHHNHTLKLPYITILRDSIIILLAALSIKHTPASIRLANKFTWRPIAEVAILFAGIFATIIPALNILQHRGAELNLVSPSQFFWVTGLLSSFLDNTPTYLAFISTAGQIGSPIGIMTDLGLINEHILAAISCGAVFMGANTYIGNAPNFMVKAIAEENNISMPCFFSYILWSGAILFPLFLLNTVLFFR